MPSPCSYQILPNLTTLTHNPVPVCPAVPPPVPGSGSSGSGSGISCPVWSFQEHEFAIGETCVDIYERSVYVYTDLTGCTFPVTTLFNLITSISICASGSGSSGSGSGPPGTIHLSCCPNLWPDQLCVTVPPGTLFDCNELSAGFSFIVNFEGYFHPGVPQYGGSVTFPSGAYFNLAIRFCYIGDNDVGFWAAGVFRCIGFGGSVNTFVFGSEISPTVVVSSSSCNPPDVLFSISGDTDHLIHVREVPEDGCSSVGSGSSGSGGSGGTTVTVDCGNCTTMPVQWSLTVAGVTYAEFGCGAACDNYNGTYILHYIGGCEWRTTEDDVCVGGKLYRLLYVSVDEKFKLYAGDVIWEIAKADVVDCLGDITLTAPTTSSTVCNTWPGTITIHPVL